MTAGSKGEYVWTYFLDDLIASTLCAHEPEERNGAERGEESDKDVEQLRRGRQYDEAAGKAVVDVRSCRMSTRLPRWEVRRYSLQRKTRRRQKQRKQRPRRMRTRQG